MKAQKLEKLILMTQSSFIPMHETVVAPHVVVAHLVGNTRATPTISETEEAPMINEKKLIIQG
jgi:hypothetical protein